MAAGAEHAAKDVAEAIVSQIGAQCESLNSLALAVCAGTLGVLFTLVEHNHDDPRHAIVMKWRSVAFWALLAECLSLLAGYFVRGALVSVVPFIYKQDYEKPVLFSQMTFDGSVPLKVVASAQFWFFFAGVFLLTIVFFFNMQKLLKKR